MHFDGKSSNNLEHQVVVLHIEEMEIRLTALVLPLNHRPLPMEYKIL
jgi:hypothetical protein